MISIVCDSCKKAIPNAESGVNFIYVTNRTVCKSCEESLEKRTREAILKDGQYSLEGYKRHYLESLEEICN